MSFSVFTEGSSLEALTSNCCMTTESQFFLK